LEEKRIVYKVLVRKPKGKRLVGRPRRGWVGMEQVHLPQNRDKWWALVKVVKGIS
jgi:hypothetical protein